MDNAFREMFEGMKQTADGLIAANVGIKRMADAALLVRDDSDSLREHVKALETMVLELTAEVRRLRPGGAV